MAIAKLITFSVNASDSVYFSRRTDPVKRGMDDQLYHAFTFDPSKSLLQRYKIFPNCGKKGQIIIFYDERTKKIRNFADCETTIPT
jgi:hypothetical protein